MRGNMRTCTCVRTVGRQLAAPPWPLCRCRVGEGVAVLCGTHPELPHECVEEALGLIHSREEQQHLEGLAGELRAWGRQRRAFWLALLLACCKECPGGEGVVCVGASGQDLRAA